ncbi:MAG: hypothetical protein KID00_03275 [Clostridium argentinense]|uniref:Uncharacterized protein n=1 Tax=Clostridium faecium TaxID=2762223 RepID=A0ABR8YPA4_9CLOT|nr:MULTISPECIES: hypothetical protein [Clostridium]MBD8046026.1 hypothetical protein [Clostridium faecium]MBS5822875.1 hypothetical protein [Clostridium argentinense]MDU1349112.1 hypothetical protein [Clostridium argentinense]
MLKKEDIKTALEDLNFPKEHYWVLAGASLVMHGVKGETRDIDLGCSKFLFEQLIKEGHRPIVLNNSSRFIRVNEEVEIFEEWNVDNIELINDLPVGSLESIRKHKIELGREKDLKDIQLIDKFLKKK